ncbi:transaldolase [Microbacterium sp. MRS-1]|uniref:transaldolase n=1 Tax=Microbacterium sp. MRS-1 TaxID=1451261 RepID=UPI000446079E|nr:transaldolase [Microbacterium sp. MRS-1]EXJ50659.1 transaldolase [Microbacterium sp. MRS-1]
MSTPTPGSTPTQQLVDAGVSIWLDDLSRARIASGNLADLISSRNVSGVTTNPSIFQAAIGNQNDDSYDAPLAALAEGGADVDAAIFELTTTDVRDAADIFRGVFDATGGVDGRVSIEVSPDLAHDTDATVAEAEKLWAKVDRPNALIKIPATKAGLPAITAVIGAGISVNVTLIFSLERYAEVIDAYLAGLEQAKAAGHDLSGIHSVASFFVSRVDTEVDKRLSAFQNEDAEALKSRAGLANARLAYELFEQRFATARAQELISAGANVQRPLWASTGVKDPALPDTLYVTELVAPGTVNTMPEKTLEATFDHGVITGDTVTGAYDDAHLVFSQLAELGVDITDVTQTLEDEGVAKFIASWQDLKKTVAEALAKAPETSR